MPSFYKGKPRQNVIKGILRAHFRAFEQILLGTDFPCTAQLWIKYIKFKQALHAYETGSRTKLINKQINYMVSIGFMNL